MSNKIKIYVLHYTCGEPDERVTCYHKACDLCSMHNPHYYEERYVTTRELFNLIDIQNTSGSYIHISTVPPEGWHTHEELYGISCFPRV